MPRSVRSRGHQLTADPTPSDLPGYGAYPHDHRGQRSSRVDGPPGPGGEACHVLPKSNWPAPSPGVETTRSWPTWPRASGCACLLATALPRMLCARSAPSTSNSTATNPRIGPLRLQQQLHLSCVDLPTHAHVHAEPPTGVEPCLETKPGRSSAMSEGLAERSTEALPTVELRALLVLRRPCLMRQIHSASPAFAKGRLLRREHALVHGRPLPHLSVIRNNKRTLLEPARDQKTTSSSRWRCRTLLLACGAVAKVFAIVRLSCGGVQAGE